MCLDVSEDTELEKGGEVEGKRILEMQRYDN